MFLKTKQKNSLLVFTFPWDLEIHFFNNIIKSKSYMNMEFSAYFIVSSIEKKSGSVMALSRL